MISEQLQAVFTLNDSAFSRGSDRILAALDRIEKKSSSTGNSLQKGFDSPLGSLTKFAGGLFAVDKALDLLKQGLKVTSDLQRLEAGLSNVSSSSLEFAANQSYLRSLSDKLGISYETLTSSYKGLKAATRGTNLEGSQTQKIFTAVTHAGAALKLTNEDIKGTLLALTQMISKGTVSMEEMRQQLGERLPGAFQLAARAMGVEEAQLVKMISSGKVLANDLLPKLASELEKTYGAKAQSNVDSMAGGWQRAADQLSFYVAEFSQTNGIDKFFEKIIKGTGDAIAGMREMQLNGRGFFSSILPNVFNWETGSNAQEAARMRSEFASLSRDQQKARLELLTEQISKATAAQNLYLQPLLKSLKTEYFGNRRLDRIEGNRSFTTVVDPADLLKQKKERFDYLKDKKGGLATIGQSLSKNEANEYARLSRELAKAEAATKKFKETFSAKVGGISTDERLLKQYTDQIQEMGDKTPIATRALKALFEKRVEYNNWLASNKGVDLGESGKRIDTEKKFLDVLLQQVAPLQRMQGLLNRFGEVGNWRGISFLQEQIEKIRFHADSLAVDPLNKNLKLDPDTLRQLREYVGLLAKADINRRNMDRQVSAAQGKAYESEIKQNSANGNGWLSKGVLSSQNWTDSAYSYLAEHRDEVIGSAQEMVDTLENVLRGGAKGAMGAMGELVNGLIAGTANMDDLPGAVLGVVADMLKNLATALAASAAAMMLVPPLIPQAIAQGAGAVGLFAAAELARASAQKKTRAMAKGGTLSGPTELIAGEYPGASQKNRNEWVSPVDVGAKLIAENLMQMGGLGGGGTLVTEIHGNTIRLILERQNRIDRATGRRK